MEYRTFCGEKISLLGMGNMRLPTREDGTIDREKGMEIIDYLYRHGVNYFDTAYVYHGGKSEGFVGDALARYPRETWHIATKTPGHVINPNYDPAACFEEEIRRCRVDYFDFYLLHNVTGISMNVYTDKKLRVLDYLLEQKKEGRIRHLGFSTHAQPDLLEKYLEEYGKYFEFVQIQLNYLDWTLQDAKRKYETITKMGLPVVVMETCRGGRLAKLDPATEKAMKELRPNDSVASWAFRYAGSKPGVRVCLSGMNTMEQAEDNVKTFSPLEPITDAEQKVLDKAAAGMLNILPCTGCRYCCEGCPQQLDIPSLLQIYNDCRFEPSLTSSMALEALPEDKRPGACLGCGACAQACPQGIDIPGAMKDLDRISGTLPKWSEISRSRVAADKKKG